MKKTDQDFCHVRYADVWKEMEFVITSYRHITGYWEADIELRNL